MMVFLKFESIDVWQVREDGPYIPTKVVDEEQTFKAKEEWDECDKKMESYNNKAIHILFYALSKTHFKNVQQCQNIHDIWRTLEITYERTFLLYLCRSCLDLFSLMR